MSQNDISQMRKSGKTQMQNGELGKIPNGKWGKGKLRKMRLISES